MGFLLSVEVSCASRPASPEQQAAALTKLQALVDETNANPTVERLAAFEKQNSGTQAAALARFLRGVEAFRSNNFTVAIDAFQGQEIYTNTGLGDYALYYWAQSLEKMGKTDEAYRIYDRVVKEHTESIFFADARNKAAEELLAKGDAKGAIKYVAEPAASGDPASILITGKAQEALGNRDAAVTAYKRIYFEIPATNECDIAEARLKELGVNLNEPFQAVLGRAEKLYDGHYYGVAVKAYELTLAQYADQISNKDLFNLHYGISLYSSSNYPTATSVLQTVTNHDPDLHAQALYYLSESHRHQRLIGPFTTTVNQLLEQHPNSELAPVALYNLGAYYEKSSGAGSYYTRLLQKYPTAPGADVASFYLAWQTHQGRNYKLASDQLLLHVANYPQSDDRSKAAFWSAFDAERAGNRETAMAIYQAILTRYQYSYYGVLAQKHLEDIKRSYPGAKPAEAIANSPLARAIANLQLSPAPQETMTSAAEPRLRKANDLKNIGLYDLATNEIELARKVSPNSPKINLVAADILVRRGEPFLAITALKRAYPDYPYYHQEDIPKEVWDVFFPLRDWKTIKEEAAKYNMDPYFVAGIIRQETIFNPKATSRANARGMMQLLYSTARPVARKYGLPEITVGDLYDPVINIKLGVAHLSELFSNYGRPEYVAAAYNAGPGRLIQWKRELPMSSMEEWIESIPISETRLYIQGVLRNAANYRRLYNDDGSYKTNVGANDKKQTS